MTDSRPQTHIQQTHRIHNNKNTQDNTDTESAHNMGGTRGSGVLASACDVLEMSVVRGVGGLCDMCMCFARGGVGGVVGKWVTGFGLGFANYGGTWG